MNNPKRKLEKNSIHTNVKQIKYLGRNLNKEVKDLHTVNYKTLLKHKYIETSHVHRLEDIILLKCPTRATDTVHSLSKSQWIFLQKYKR